MSDTHSTIKQKFRESLQKRDARRDELHDVARKLLKSYKDSLSLPSEMWTDKSGVERQYVLVGFYNNKNLFQKQLISSIPLDKDLSLSFTIYTYIDDSGSGISSSVPISIYKEVGTYYVSVGQDSKSLRIMQLEACDAFDQVNEAIKSSVISSFSDPRLDW